MKTRTYTFAVLWLILSAFLLYTDLEVQVDQAISHEEQETGTNPGSAASMRERPPPERAGS